MKDNRTYIGIDVGGTFIKLGIIADDGRILKRHKVSVDRSGRMSVMDTIISAVKELCSMCGNDPNAGAAPESRNSEAAPVKPGEASAREIRSDCMPAEGSFGRPAGIGICAPGSIDTVNGRVAINGGNVPDWSGTEIRSILEKKFGIPVAVANDGNCAVLGEAWIGAARGCSDVVCVTLGTGVGGGIISGGRLLGGRHGFAGEIGHFPIHPGEGDICECGSRGCYESFASASALVKKASSADPSWNDGHAIFAAVDAGNEEALSLVGEWLDEVALGIKALVHLLDPEVILIGGGVSAQEKNVILPLEKRVRAMVMPDFAEGLVIKGASLGNDAGMVGAVRNLKETYGI